LESGTPNEADCDESKLHRYTINGTLKLNVNKETKLIVYKIMAVLALWYGHERRIKKNKNPSNIQSAGKKYFKKYKEIKQTIKIAK